MGIEKGEEVQAKGICNTFNKIITKIPKSREASRTANRLDQNRTTTQHIIIKTTTTENKEY
jgi:hypothetical protein